MSAIDAFIEKHLDDNKPKQPDEFTMDELKQRIVLNGHTMSESALRRRISDLVTDGVLIKRKGVFNKIQANLFRFA